MRRFLWTDAFDDGGSIGSVAESTDAFCVVEELVKTAEPEAAIRNVIADKISVLTWNKNASALNCVLFIAWWLLLIHFTIKTFY